MRHTASASGVYARRCAPSSTARLASLAIWPKSCGCAAGCIWRWARLRRRKKISWKRKRWLRRSMSAYFSGESYKSDLQIMCKWTPTEESSQISEGAFYLAAGSVNMNVLPIPSPGLPAQMRPPWASIRCLAMVSPTPLPPETRERERSAR
jgi:hypothetical protein